MKEHRQPTLLFQVQRLLTGERRRYSLGLYFLSASLYEADAGTVQMERDLVKERKDSCGGKE